MLDCVVAACCQMGDTARMLETFEAYAAFGLAPGAQAYNACIAGFIRHSLLDRLPFVRARPARAACAALRRRPRCARRVRSPAARPARAADRRTAVPARVMGCTRARIA
jgi:hypothetical protein